jgi:hypothetical protein
MDPRGRVLHVPGCAGQLSGETLSLRLALLHILEIRQLGLAEGNVALLERGFLSLRIFARANASAPEALVTALLSTGLLQVLLGVFMHRTHNRGSLRAIPQLVPFITGGVDPSTERAKGVP